MTPKCSLKPLLLKDTTNLILFMHFKRSVYDWTTLIKNKLPKIELMLLLRL